MRIMERGACGGVRQGSSSASSARMPPSPLLSARSTNNWYLRQTMMTSDQNTSDSTPEHALGSGGETIAGGEGAAQGIERAGADVAEHHAERAQAQGVETLTVHGRFSAGAAVAVAAGCDDGCGCAYVLRVCVLESVPQNATGRRSESDQPVRVNQLELGQ